MYRWIGLALALSATLALAQNTQRPYPSDSEAQAVFFLSQAGLGNSPAQIEEVLNAGFEGWIAQQAGLPASRLEDHLFDLVRQVGLPDDEPPFDPMFFHASWWQMTLESPDVLRQRMAWALSQIMVISLENDELFDRPLTVTRYYDILLQHALGNFRDLLRDVSLHPAMGVYLTHMGNRLGDPATQRFPDENYARELMQLFTIGLYELENDGRLKRDASGQPIPTYDNDDIEALARVFTGLHDEGAQFIAGDFVIDEEFDLALLEPMQMFELAHDREEKRFLQATLPAGQDGLRDIEQALDVLFHHPNVGPFISRQLIQRLVQSNPSSAYVGRVSAVFADNGRGVRGDLAAVARAILLDPEARSRGNIATAGKLREPLLRYAHFLRTLEARSESSIYTVDGEYLYDALGQYPLQAPSVFNFYAPDYRPPGALSAAGVSAPEFMILNSVTALQGFNLVMWSVWDDSALPLIDEFEYEDEQLRPLPVEPVELNWALLAQDDVADLVDRLDLLLTARTLSNASRVRLTQALAQIDDEEDRARMALELLLTAPDVAVRY